MMATERVDFLTLLPDSLLQKILLPLPVESLVSLASTCKKWRDYLTDDDFARLHLDQWRSRYGILYTNPRNNLVYSPIFDGKANKLILARLEDCFSRILKEDNHFRVLDSCDGMLLIVCDYHDIRKHRLVVCNPLMRSFQLLQLPPTLVFTCHWNMVYDASIKRYKITGMTREKVTISMKNGVNGVRGRRVYILELCRSSSELKLKEVSVCDDELGGKIQKTVLVDEKGEKKKLYYLTYNDDRSEGDEVRTSLVYIDIETHQVRAVEAAACSSMSLLCKYIWVGSSSTGRFYMSVLGFGSEEFDLFVLEDLHNPIWKRRLINGSNHDLLFIKPLVVVQHDGDDEEEKMLYERNGMIYEYQTERNGMIYEYQTGRLLSNDSGHNFTCLPIGYCSPSNFYVPHLHSLIII